ncbi:hypothetical protein EMIHUDRAFT_351563, partial [Emiliania huxleyi CCMP1516]|uniref:Uncharacterized protein n=2 Tax=Emiliania huxleyi TaxID=2903 RepID=A0A0D3KVC3_EMIH1
LVRDEGPWARLGARPGIRHGLGGVGRCAAPDAVPCCGSHCRCSCVWLGVWLVPGGSSRGREPRPDSLSEQRLDPIEPLRAERSTEGPWLGHVLVSPSQDPTYVTN